MAQINPLANPVSRRPFRAFLSHSHLNREITDRLFDWMVLAGFRIWYDAKELTASTKVAGALANAIQMCRATLIVVSESSVRSGWVEEELEASVQQRSTDNDFQIIPIKIDDCELPPALRTTKWVEAPGGELNGPIAEQLLYALHNVAGRRPVGDTQDIYISRSWRAAEAAFPDAACRAIADRGFRLIGDAKDQQGFLGGHRVQSIIESCGAVLAIVPHRCGGKTSEYILREIEIAAEKGVPTIVLAQNGCSIPDSLATPSLWWSQDDLKAAEQKLAAVAEELTEIFRPPPRPHYAFLATDFAPEHAARKQAARDLIQRVTAMPCVIGDDIREGSIQSTIVERIRGAFLMVADISEENLNTCIEAGVARGSGIPLFLIGRGPRRRPPFLFRDAQVHYYDTDAEMLANISRVVEPFRRRVLDDELTFCA